MSTLRKIEGKIKFSKKFTFCTLVTRPEEYLEMVESAKLKGSSSDDIEFIYFDNKNSNQFDGYSGVNRAIKEANGEYLIYCHQDILFKYDNRDILEQRLNELNNINPQWAIASNAGRSNKGKHFVRITDPHGDNINEGPFPQEIMSVDENFFIINQNVNISASSILKGFHLYGLDLCQNASSLGLRSYIIDFHLFHKSSGSVDQSYYNIQKKYIELQRKRKLNQWFFPMCSIFFVSSNHLLNLILNTKKIKKIIFKYLK